MINKITVHLSILAFSCSLLTPSLSFSANPHHHHGSNAPIGIMGDHLMHEDEWMISYRMMNMDMDGNRTGSTRVTTPLAGFMVSPLKMNMNMHMFGGMAGITKDITLMIMFPYITSDMDHIVNAGPMAGTLFTTDSKGLGDTKISANWNDNTAGILFNAGVSLPTGSIDKADVNPASPTVAVQMPYPMQLGSGTFDLLLGATKTGYINDMHWGAQVKAIIRTGENDHDYTLGDEYNATAWLGRPLSDSMSASFRLNAINRGNIDGADPTLIPGPTVPTKETNLRGGTRVDTIIGIDLTIDNNVLGLEVGVPIYQNLDGPQLETDATITLGWQASY